MQEVVKVTNNHGIEIYTHSDNVEVKNYLQLDAFGLAGIGKRV